MLINKTDNDIFTSGLHDDSILLKDNHTKHSLPDYYTYNRIANVNIWLQFITTITAIMIPVSIIFYISSININQQVNNIMSALLIINLMLFTVSLFRRSIITIMMMKLLGVKKHYNIMQCNAIGRKPLDSFNNSNSLRTLRVLDNRYAYSRKAHMLISYAIELKVLSIAQDKLNDMKTTINTMSDGNTSHNKTAYYDVIERILTNISMKE